MSPCADLLTSLLWPEDIAHTAVGVFCCVPSRVCGLQEGGLGQHPPKGGELLVLGAVEWCLCSRVCPVGSRGSRVGVWVGAASAGFFVVQAVHVPAVEAVREGRLSRGAGVRLEVAKAVLGIVWEGLWGVWGHALAGISATDVASPARVADPPLEGRLWSWTQLLPGTRLV